jgi:hypothetical protein
MQLNTVSSPSLDGIHSDRADAPAPLRVVIAYDDRAAGRRALAMLNRVLRHEPGAVHLIPSLWRFDVLETAECSERALADAIAADLFILSTSASETIAAGIERWVSTFLSRRRGTGTAILALFGPDDEWSISIQEADSAATKDGRTEPTTLDHLCRASAA